MGALLGLFGGVVTAAPAFARGPKWQFAAAKPFTLPALFCGFKVQVAPQVDKSFFKILKTSDGSMTFLSTGMFTVSYKNLQTGKTVTENESGPAKPTVFPDGSSTVTAGAQRELPHASRRAAVRAADRERDRGTAETARHLSESSNATPPGARAYCTNPARAGRPGAGGVPLMSVKKVLTGKSGKSGKSGNGDPR